LIVHGRLVPDMAQPFEVEVRVKGRSLAAPTFHMMAAAVHKQDKDRKVCSSA